MQEIEIIDVTENEITVTEKVPTAENTVIKHSSLAGRCSDNQHSINAIIGLSDELEKITTPRTIESDEIGVADYYQWYDNNSTQSNRVGYFVTCKEVNGKQVIQICDGSEDEDVFGVTVDSAAFIGGQNADVAIPRDYRYGLVATNGFVTVRCESDVKIGNNVIPSATGIAKNSNTNYGNRVIYIHEEHADTTVVRYARIFLGMSPKQASDIAGDLKQLETDMDNAQAAIEVLMENDVDFNERISTRVNITGGQLAKWDVTENSLEKTFKEDSGAQYKAVLDSGATDTYVFGVKEVSESGDSWKFGIKPNGDVDGSFGGWNVNKDGFKIEHTQQENVYAVRGAWLWNATISMANADQIVGFTSNQTKFMGLKYDSVADGILYYNNSDSILVYDNVFDSWSKVDESYRMIDFGSVPQLISETFYEYLLDNATPDLGGTIEVYEGTTCTAALGGNVTTDGINTNILEIKNNDVLKFYLKLDGRGYISNAESAEYAKSAEHAGVSDNALHADVAEYAGVADVLSLTPETSENSFMTITQTGVYVVDVEDTFFESHYVGIVYIHSLEEKTTTLIAQISETQIYVTMNPQIEEGEVSDYYGIINIEILNDDLSHFKIAHLVKIGAFPVG